ncbi:putative ATPase [Actinocorallia herbida]|uniref:Putative ATPase n=1 Tax=Actinocorallia herbida TaxID=58109 RepID=A0A3N1CYT4_9ACTN|nr:regulator [Actinocorallia herbida]ROO86444.1 putative ATPase [Actinocorallia herbida]
MTRETHPRRGNISTDLSSFVGRDAELVAIERVLRTERLVTLTGVGGVGKTRTALEAAVTAAPDFPDGVWVVRLSQLRDGTLLPHLICREMRLQDQTTRPMAEVLADRLAGARCLLVLDGCEHLLESCAMMIMLLLGVAPGVKIIATSRQPLGVRGESRIDLTPLAADREAVQLFAERAAAVAPGFALTEATRPIVAGVCAHLDGIPLAVELAAALVAELPVADLGARIQDRFALETERKRGGGAPAHHATLWTAIGWSHELCTPEERLLWARLSVFAGSFTSATAQDVCSGGPLTPEDVRGTLAQLVDKSLVKTRDGRYALLDTIAEFGAHWLRELGEDRALRLGHRDHYRAAARHAFGLWFTAGQADLAQRFAQDFADLQVALETCFTEPGDAVLELLGALWFFWYCCGHQREGRHYFERALAHDATPGYHRMRASWAYGLVVLAQGDVEACNGAVEICTSAAVGEDKPPTGVSARASAYLRGTAWSIRGDADLAMRIVAPFDTLPEAGGAHEAEGMREATALMVQACVSYIHIVRGDYAEAVALARWIRAEGERRGEFKYRSWGDYIWALAALGTGDLPTAVDHARQALEANRRLGDYWGMALVLDSLALALAGLGESEQAATVLGTGEQAWRATFGTAQFGSPELAAARQACEQQIRAAIGDADYEKAFLSGLDTPLTPALPTV